MRRAIIIVMWLWPWLVTELKIPLFWFPNAKQTYEGIKCLISDLIRFKVSCVPWELRKKWSPKVFVCLYCKGATWNLKCAKNKKEDNFTSKDIFYFIHKMVRCDLYTFHLYFKILYRSCCFSWITFSFPNYLANIWCAKVVYTLCF